MNESARINNPSITIPTFSDRHHGYKIRPYCYISHCSQLFLIALHLPPDSRLQTPTLVANQSPPFPRRSPRQQQAAQAAEQSYHHAAPSGCKYRKHGCHRTYQRGSRRGACSRCIRRRRHGCDRGSSCGIVSIEYDGFGISVMRAYPRIVSAMLIRTSAPQPATMKTPTGGTGVVSVVVWMVEMA